MLRALNGYIVEVGTMDALIPTQFLTNCVSKDAF